MEGYRQDAQFGTVVTLRPGLTVEEANKIISKILAMTDVESVLPPHGFDPQWGGPVWYIP